MPTACTIVWMWSRLPDHLRMQFRLKLRPDVSQGHPGPWSVFTVVESSAHMVETFWQKHLKDHVHPEYTHTHTNVIIYWPPRWRKVGSSFVFVTEHFWSFTVKQLCGIIPNNWGRKKKKKDSKNMAPCLFSLVLCSAMEVEAQKSQVVLKLLPVASKPKCATLLKDKWAWQHSTGVNSIFWIQFGISGGVRFVVLFFRSPRLHQMFMRMPPNWSASEALGVFCGLRGFTWRTVFGCGWWGMEWMIAEFIYLFFFIFGLDCSF